MSDVEQYIERRMKDDPAFAEGYDRGYTNFRIGTVLRQARESAGLTQEQVAQRLMTTKSVISRMENHADDVRLSTLRKYAEAVGARLMIQLVQ